MKVVVTGCNGYLGNVLVPILRAHGHKVVGIDLDLFCPTDDLGRPYAQDIRGVDWDELFNVHFPVGAVVHLAAVSNDPASELDPRLTHDINTLATVRLATATARHRIPRFVFASSASVYGKIDEMADEDAPKDPQTAYAKSKLAAEENLLDLASREFSPIILRFGTLFGPSRRMRFDLAVNLMVKDALTRGSIHVYGGNQWRPFLHVADAARAILHALDAPPDPCIVNLACENIEIELLASMIQLVLDPIALPVVLVTDTQDTRDYVMDTARMEYAWKFKPKRTLQEGIVQVAGWILDAQDKCLDLNDDRYYTIKCWKRYIADVTDKAWQLASLVGAS